LERNKYNELIARGRANYADEPGAVWGEGNVKIREIWVRRDAKTVDMCESGGPLANRTSRAGATCDSQKTKKTHKRTKRVTMSSAREPVFLSTIHDWCNAAGVGGPVKREKKKNIM